MATIQFLRGTQAGLTALTAEQIVDGALYFTTDSHKMYMGTAAGLQEYSAIEVVDNIAALPAVGDAISGKFYYAKAENVFCFPGTDGWHQVNPDTGATSIEVVGEGNAVTEASYDAATRKITLTKGATYATPAEVDTKISDVVGEIPADGEGAAQTVRAYIDAKTSGIATDAALGELQERVAGAEGDIEALQGLVGETAVATQISDAVKVVEDALATYKTDNDAAVAAAQGAADAAQADVDALSGKVGEVIEGKTVVEMIADAQTAATYDDAQVKADIAANTEAIAAEKARMDAFMTLEDGETLNSALDSLKEIQDYITNEAADADILVGKVSALEGIVAGIGGESDESKTVVAYVTAAIDALKIGDYALAADLTAAVERIAALEAATHTHDNKTVLDGISAEKVAAWDASEQNAKDYADGLNTTMDGRVATLEAIDHEAYVGADATNLQAAKDYADGLAVNYDVAGAADTAETNAKTYTDTALTWLEF